MALIDFTAQQQQEHDAGTTPEQRKSTGHFGTPPAIAEFMAGMFSRIPEGEVRILDPGAGVGTLAAALCERIARLRNPRKVFIQLWENDPILKDRLAVTMEECERVLSANRHSLEYEIRTEDFVLAHARRSLFDEGAPPSFHLSIMNPPYFKLRKDSPHAKAMRHVVHGQPNMYALFMAAAVEHLLDEGELVAITPRSYANGLYFLRFRRWFFNRMAARHIHIFESRTDAFRNNDVLQENVILHGTKTDRPDHLMLTSSPGRELREVVKCTVPYSRGVDTRNGDIVLRITTNPVEQRLLEVIDSFPETFKTLGFKVSTGPVVYFRATEYLLHSRTAHSAPLLWMHNVRPFLVRFPEKNNGKAGHIEVSDRSLRLLLPSKRYVLLKRFTAKEEKRRLVAGIMERSDSYADFVGLENKLNYVDRTDGELSEDEAFGLAGLFNSEFVDRYFRAISGNTQVNASDIRNLPMPELPTVSRLGALVRSARSDDTIETERLVGKAIGLPDDLINSLCESKWAKEKRPEILKALGLPRLPRPQQNERSCLTLLALAGLTEEDPWADAKRPMLRIWDIMGWMDEKYGKKYAPNTRETVRRQTIHQFEQARLIDRNPDDPKRPTNSGDTNYQLTNDAADVLRSFGTHEFEMSCQEFLERHGSLTKAYEKARSLHKVPVTLHDSSKVELSPGDHNELQRLIVEEFAPRFAPGSIVAYMGDAAEKRLVIAGELLERLNIPEMNHDKLPDVVLYDPKRKWLFLIEAVTTHGPVSPKRHHELELTLADCPAERVYVTAFPDFKAFRRYATEIVWESEVWIAEAPDHMIHYNGDKFLGPYPPRDSL